MSDKVLLNKSFNNNPKEQILYLENDIIHCSYKKKGKDITEDIDLHDVKTISVLNARCPSPLIRFLCVVLEALGVLSVLIAITLRKNTVPSVILIVVGIIFLLGAALFSKIMTGRAAEAIEITIRTKSGKRVFLGCRTSKQDYNQAIRLVKECKKNCKHIAIDMQSKI